MIIKWFLHKEADDAPGGGQLVSYVQGQSELLFLSFTMQLM